MSHHPEDLAALYLSGLPRRTRRAYEGHLLTCEACWTEVSLARRGRELAEAAPSTMPAGTRDDIRAAVTAAAADPAHSPPAPPRRVLLAATVGVTVIAAAATTTVLRSWPHEATPLTAASAPASRPTPTAGTALAAALAGFRDDRLPGTAVPPDPAPDLSPLGLSLVAAGSGHLGQAAVTMYAYRSPAGTRLVVYRSTQPIPETDQSHEIPGAETSWSLMADGITVICGPDTHTVLLLSTDPTIVRRAGDLLDLV